MKFQTKCVHRGVKKDDQFNSVITPIYNTSTFAFNKLREEVPYDYTRSGNPTRTALEENLAALEGGLKAYCTCTGMAAITGVLHLLKTGDHVITGMDIYGGTFRVMTRIFSEMGITFSFIDITDPENVKKAIKDNTKMIWIETPSNPLLRITDLKAVSAIAKEAGILSVIDNTFATPYYQKPFEHGIDIIVHSTTKYLNGHSDVVGGAIIVNDEALGEQVYFRINAMGIGEAPFDAWLVLRGVKTLGPRMEIHNKNTMAITEYLETHSKVKKVYYPGLKSHAQHNLACSQMSGFGGMFSFEVDLSKVNLENFFSKLKLFDLAVSLGGVESLIESPWYMSHASMTEEAKIKAGIPEGLIRVSVGIEDKDDLIRDLEQALE